MASPGAMLFDWRDFWASDDVQMMNEEQVAAYVRLLSAQWENGDLPADPRRLAALLTTGVRTYTVANVVGSERLPGVGFDTEATLEAPLEGSLWAGLKPCFGPHPEKEGRIVNPRVFAEREAWIAKRELYREAGRKGGKRSGKVRKTQGSKPPRSQASSPPSSQASATLEPGSSQPQARSKQVPSPSIPSDPILSEPEEEDIVDDAPEPASTDPTKELQAELKRQLKREAKPEEMREIKWRIQQTWKAFVRQRVGFWEDTRAQAPPGAPPTLTAAIRGDIIRSLRLYDREILGAEDRKEWERASKTRAAGVGIFFSTWHTGLDEGNSTSNGKGKLYVESWRPWKVPRGKPDPVEGFAALAFEEMERAQRKAKR